MKDQINKIVGQIVIFLLKVSAIVVLCTVITVGVFEDQKEEIWLEAVESFQLLYDTKETELYEQFGIVDKDDAEQWQWENQTTNIAYSTAEKEYPAPKIIASASKSKSTMLLSLLKSI